jgi:ketosteroid isomerase-like protein
MPATDRSDEEQIRDLLESWAANTRQGRQDKILINHAPDVLIFDVLTPLKYEGAAAYRASWGEWQPETIGPGRFDLQALEVTAGRDVGFAHCLIQCGGTLESGRTFEDLVRATFCLRKIGGTWVVAHQHISRPLNKGGE